MVIEDIDFCVYGVTVCGTANVDGTTELMTERRMHAAAGLIIMSVVLNEETEAMLFDDVSGVGGIVHFFTS